MQVQNQEKQTVLKAIDDLGRRVTAADVAAKTGLPIIRSTLALNQIAAETEGHLEVSTKGDIAYRFNPGFTNSYLAKGIKRVFQQIGAQVFKVGYFLLRISFGIMLIVSFIIVMVLIIVAILYLNRGNSRDDNRGGFSLDFFDYMILRDLFWWGANTAYVPYQSHDRPTTHRPDDSNFLFNCFSFLFGDGDPNLHLEERKWQSVAQLIRKNGGTATAEQLAPYTGADPKNEDGVLPVLVRFDGRPEVTEVGNIIYLFPSLETTAARIYDVSGDLPKYLSEWTWPFTNASTDSLVPVFLLAGANFFGSLWLLYQSAHIPVLHELLPLILVLVVYGTMFIVVPCIRWLVLQVFNSRIENRNKNRQEFAAQLNNPSKELVAKLQEAKKLALKLTTVGSDKLTYTTDKDLLEQEFDAST